MQYQTKGHLLTSPRHIQGILRWHVAPGLLKSQAAQVASFTMAGGCKETKMLTFVPNEKGK